MAITENIKRVTSTEALSEMWMAGPHPPKMMITRIDEIWHIYVLAKSEAVFNCHNYYDKQGNDAKFTRIDAEKKFNIFSGKVAELECQRQIMNQGFGVISGTILFSPCADKGVDQEYEGLSRVQIKYRHGKDFKIDAGDLGEWCRKSIKLLVVKCDEFYKDYVPCEASLNWREPPCPPKANYGGWYVYRIDIVKAKAAGKTQFKFDEREYVSWSLVLEDEDDETKLRLYLDGKLDLSVDDLRQIRLSLDEDIAVRPEPKYWAQQGYASRDEWYDAHEESLAEYDRSVDARQTLFAKIEERLGFEIKPADYPAGCTRA